MKRILLGLFIILFLFTGCAKNGRYMPVQDAQDDFEVRFLFECEGVRICRFSDSGRFLYFAVKRSSMTEDNLQISNITSKDAKGPYWDVLEAQ